MLPRRDSWGLLTSASAPNVFVPSHKPSLVPVASLEFGWQLRAVSKTVCVVQVSGSFLLRNTYSNVHTLRWREPGCRTRRECLPAAHSDEQPRWLGQVPTLGVDCTLPLRRRIILDGKYW